MTKSAQQKPAVSLRNAEATRERILKAAKAEFARHGYGGARVERICKSARTNIRMLYHYFGNKEALYLRVLESTYRSIRTLEQELDYEGQTPSKSMAELVRLTFDFLTRDPYFVRIIMSENLLMGKTVRKSKLIPKMTQPLLEALDRMLRRGQRDGIFRGKLTAVQLYTTILGLCFIHVSNRYTLSNMFQEVLAKPEWLHERKDIVTDVVMSYLISPQHGAAAWSSLPEAISVDQRHPKSSGERAERGTHD